MKSSLLVIATLFASVQSIKIMSLDTFVPEETMDLQIGVEARARANARNQIIADLRSYLQSDSERIGGPLKDNAPPHNRYPEWILPGSEPILPKPSASIDLQLGAELERIGGPLKDNAPPHNRYPEWILPGSEPILPKPSASLDVQLSAEDDGEMTVE